MRFALHTLFLFVTLAVHQVHALPAAAASTTKGAQTSASGTKTSQAAGASSSASASAEPSPVVAPVGKAWKDPGQLKAGTAAKDVTYNAKEVPVNFPAFPPSAAPAKVSDAACEYVPGSAGGASSAKASGSAAGKGSASPTAKGAAKTPSARMLPTKESSDIAARGPKQNQCVGRGQQLLTDISKANGKDVPGLMDNYYKAYKPYSSILPPGETVQAARTKSMFTRTMKKTVSNAVRLMRSFEIFKELKAENFYTGIVDGSDGKKNHFSYLNLFSPKHGIVVALGDFSKYDVVKPKATWDVIAFAQYQQANQKYIATKKTDSTSAPKYILMTNVEGDTAKTIKAIFKKKGIVADTLWHAFLSETEEEKALLGTTLGHGAGQMLAHFAGSMKERKIRGVWMNQDPENSKAIHLIVEMVKSPSST